MSDDAIIIVGAGLAGLTLAACCIKAGMEIAVYEQAEALEEVGAGIQLSANPMRVMDHLGLVDKLTARGFCPSEYRFQLYNSGEVLQRIPLGEGYINRHGVPYVSLHRADLLEVLFEGVRDLDANVLNLGHKLVDFTEDETGVTALFENGEEVRGKVLLAGDGIKSLIRQRVLGETPVHYTGDQSWRILVPAERVAPQFRPDTVNICVGPGKHGVTYTIRNDGLINMVGAVEYETWDEESWTARYPWTELKTDFEGWFEDIQVLIDVVDKDQCYRWAMNDRAPVANWSTSRVTLMGDAAHASLPYMAQGGAMAIEDAAVLYRALQLETQIPNALQLYQRNRLDRTRRVVLESAANRDMFHLPSETALRDAFAKRDMNAERNDWLFSYDALTVPLH